MAGLDPAIQRYEKSSAAQTRGGWMAASGAAMVIQRN
jgi:hypothetical protein